MPMMLENSKPGPPEADRCIPPVPAVKLPSVSAHKARFVPHSRVVLEGDLQNGMSVGIHWHSGHDVLPGSWVSEPAPVIFTRVPTKEAIWQPFR